MSAVTDIAADDQMEFMKIDLDQCDRIVLKSGVEIRIRRGTYREFFYNKREVFTAIDLDRRGMVVGTTDEVAAMWFNRGDAPD